MTLDEFNSKIFWSDDSENEELDTLTSQINNFVVNEPVEPEVTETHIDNLSSLFSDCCEGELTTNFAKMYELHFHNQEKKIVLSNLSSYIRMQLHALCEEKGLFHYTLSSAKSFTIESQIGEIK